MIGESVFQIPPREDRYVIESECNSFCSSNTMNGSVHIISGLNHMHYMGRQMTTYMTPAGGQRQTIMHDEHYSYDNPVVHTFQTPHEFHPGDSLSTKCSFTSAHKAVTTTSGEATSQEMCFAFLFYYPKEAFQTVQCTTALGLQTCLLSHPTAVVDGCQLKTFFDNQTMWTQIFGELTVRCEKFFCRKECKTYIQEMRQHPCFNGTIGDYVDRILGAFISVNEMALYHSCDKEIALEAREACSCTTPNPRPCVEYTGSGASLQVSLYLLLVAMVAIYAK